MKNLSILAAIFLLAYCNSFAQPALRPFVSVIGDADMEVAPDMAIFRLEVSTVDKDLIQAKNSNDAGTVKTLAAARAHGVSDDDIQTDSFAIAPKFKQVGSNGKGDEQFVGYEVKKTLFITLRDLKKIDSLLSSVVTAGVNKITSVSFDNSKMRDFRERLRAMAVKNALDKAQAYARQLGLKVGRALSIREEGADSTDFGTASGSGSGNGMGDGDLWADPNGIIAGNVTFAVGKISIEDKIYVIFALD